MRSSIYDRKTPALVEAVGSVFRISMSARRLVRERREAIVSSTALVRAANKVPTTIPTTVVVPMTFGTAAGREWFTSDRKFGHL
jgi:hypothetical protein